MKPRYLVVFVTVPSAKARQIAQYVISKKKAACVNIIRGATSLFWWRGNIDTAKESLLIIKTQNKLFNSLKKAIVSKHPYKVPEIIALPIILGNREYLDWIDESVR